MAIGEKRSAALQAIAWSGKSWRGHYADDVGYDLRDVNVLD